MEDFSDLEKKAISILAKNTSDYVSGCLEVIYTPTPSNNGYSLELKLKSHICGEEGNVLFQDGKLLEITNRHDEKFKEKFLKKYETPSNLLKDLLFSIIKRFKY